MSTLRLFAALIGTYTLIALPTSSGIAQNSRTVESRGELSRTRSSVNADSEERFARDWGLDPKEWTRYRQIMQGPLGVYSPNLDPLTALGIEARSGEERRRYAELQVQAEGHRVEKLLAYQRAYDEAWKRLYPTLSPLNSSTSTTQVNVITKALAQEPQRLAVFIKDNCTACDQQVQQLQASGRAFDLYMVGSRNDDTRIREWAARVGIDPAKVRSRTITLNHDAGHWLTIGVQGEFPAVVREVNGRWQRE